MMGENTTKKQNKELAEELFETKRLFENLGVSPSIIEDEKVIEILANKEIRDTIEKYEEDIAKEIAARIAIAAHRIRNKDEIIKISRILGMDEIVNTIRKYKGSPAKEIAYRIANAAYILRNEDEIIKISRILGMDEIVNTIRKYEENIAKEIANEIAFAAYQLKDEKAIAEIGKILGMDEVINVIRKYEEDIAKEIAGWTALTAYELRDKEAIIEMARTIEKYEGDVARGIAMRIAIVASRLGDKEAVIEMARTIGKYEGSVAKEIANKIAIAACYLRDDSKIIRIVRMLEKVGKDIFDILDNYEIYEIINLGLDNLIKNRRDFDAISLYIKSNKELPLPTKNNIDNYLDLALNHLKSKYGLKKDINYDQLLLLFSTQKHLREEIINLVNISKEVNPKYYSLSIKDGDNSLNYSRNDLEKYAIIAVVGSRNKDLEKEAVNVISSIVGEKTINRARNEFYKNYKSLIKEIAIAFNQGNYEKAINILKQTNNEAINDVINAINYRDINVNSNVIKAVESKNPLDYDNRVQMACVYLPYGMHIKDGILEYCKDDRIKLIKYNIENKTLGSAICYLKDKKLLVDSIEGHRRFRKEEIFEIVYRDLIERAKEWGVEIVIFNTNVMNETSRKFIEYLKNKNLKEDVVKMELNTNAYLEAKTPIRGYVVRVS